MRVHIAVGRRPQSAGGWRFAGGYRAARTTTQRDDVAVRGQPGMAATGQIMLSATQGRAALPDDRRRGAGQFVTVPEKDGNVVRISRVCGMTTS
jgi:hypothetical protein